MYNFVKENASQQNKGDKDYQDFVKKMSAVYGEKWRYKRPDYDDQFYREIPEFFQSKTKTFTCETVS